MAGRLPASLHWIRARRRLPRRRRGLLRWIPARAPPSSGSRRLPPSRRTGSHWPRARGRSRGGGHVRPRLPVGGGSGPSSRALGSGGGSARSGFGGAPPLLPHHLRSRFSLSLSLSGISFHSIVGAATWWWWRLEVRRRRRGCNQWCGGVGKAAKARQGAGGIGPADGRAAAAAWAAGWRPGPRRPLVGGFFFNFLKKFRRVSKIHTAKTFAVRPI
jgi:hypothetical protein